jgi:hypothetical protein
LFDRSLIGGIYGHWLIGGATGLVQIFTSMSISSSAFGRRYNNQCFGLPPRISIGGPNIQKS